MKIQRLAKRGAKAALVAALLAAPLTSSAFEVNVGDTFGIFYGLTSGDPSPQLLHDYDTTVNWTNPGLIDYQEVTGSQDLGVGAIPQFSATPAIAPASPVNTAQVSATNSETPCPVAGPDVAFDAPPLAPQENEFALIFTALAPGQVVFTMPAATANLCNGDALEPATNINLPEAIVVDILAPASAPPVAVPTLSLGGLGFLGLLLAGLTWRALRNKR